MALPTQRFVSLCLLIFIIGLSTTLGGVITPPSIHEEAPAEKSVSDTTVPVPVVVASDDIETTKLHEPRPLPEGVEILAVPAHIIDVPLRCPDDQIEVKGKCRLNLS